MFQFLFRSILKVRKEDEILKKKEHTIWFNQTFSTLYPLLDVIRQDFLSACFPIKILTSSRNPNVIYQNNSDRFLVEPDCDFPTYLEWCKKICKEYQVDVFYPKRYMKELSNYRTTFEKLGTILMVEYYPLLILCSKKSYMCDMLTELSSEVKIPEFYLIYDQEDFRSAYVQLRRNWSQCCIKQNTDEGGESFHIISEKDRRKEKLLSNTSLFLSRKEVLDGLEESTREFILMPYLNGTEYSIDVYKDQVVIRKKGKIRTEEIVKDPILEQFAIDVYRKCQFQYICNIQVISYENQYYFLEINPRISGGNYIGCLSGKHLVSQCLMETLLIPYVFPDVYETQLICQAEVVEKVNNPLLIKNL